MVSFDFGSFWDRVLANTVLVSNHGLISFAYPDCIPCCDEYPLQHIHIADVAAQFMSDMPLFSYANALFILMSLCCKNEVKSSWTFIS